MMKSVGESTHRLIEEIPRVLALALSAQRGWEAHLTFSKIAAAIRTRPVGEWGRLLKAGKLHRAGRALLVSYLKRAQGLEIPDGEYAWVLERVELRGRKYVAVFKKTRKAGWQDLGQAADAGQEKAAQKYF